MIFTIVWLPKAMSAYRRLRVIDPVGAKLVSSAVAALANGPVSHGYPPAGRVTHVPPIPRRLPGAVRGRRRNGHRLRHERGFGPSISRLTAGLPDEVDARVRQEAARRGMTLSDWIGEAIEAHLPGEGSGGGGRRRRLLARSAGHSGQHDVSVRIEEILRGEASR